MALYPWARWMPISTNIGGPRAWTRAVVLHVDAGGANSLYGWFSNPSALASSHFYVKYDGSVEQYVDTDTVAWTQRTGNSSCIGIETQGVGSGAWTGNQVQAIASLVAWLCWQYHLPIVDMRSSHPDARGVGLHRYGIDPWRVSGGETWGSNGKVCPGELRVGQFPQVLERARAITKPRRKREVDDMAIIYRAGGERTPYGIFGTNGGWVELRTKEEYDNLKRAGVPEVWVERVTLNNLIADARST
ncbi:N-acetylmuramoyl-L-alanine amidase [Oerskovia sp. KBS0722]|uniref:N-acetylmuramoyl-L-alanine amidase n=1 Tax=Oerskovia sp. KBS0722 TaxID=1179673 RepID=UPI00110E049C|nr:peptidoglycan recognition family protein [Oerskovia sp. KBS0722]QDW64162.1 N-acetylmuramoyl-L-alanine amidase [Oerskovia sp. KBS0722]